MVVQPGSPASIETVEPGLLSASSKAASKPTAAVEVSRRLPHCDAGREVFHFLMVLLTLLHQMQTTCVAMSVTFAYSRAQPALLWQHCRLYLPDSIV